MTTSSIDGNLPGKPALRRNVTMPSLSGLLRGRGTGAPRSSGEKLWLAGGAVAAFFLILIGYFLLISPQRSTTSSVRSQVSAAQAQEQSLQARIAQLASQSKNLAMYQAQLAAARAALPADTGVPALLRELQTIGAATSTTVSNVSVGAPTAVTVAVPAATTTASAPASSSASPSAGAVATPAPTGLYSMAVSATVGGTTAGLNGFLQQLQAVQPRAVLITGLSESTGAGGVSGKTAAAGQTLTLTMLAFSMPSTTAATPTAAAASGAS